MKHVAKYTILVLVLVLASTVTTAFAAQSEQQGPGGPGGGVNGKVTAVGTNSLTVLTTDSKSVAVTTSSSTTVTVAATGASGSLSDIVVGSQVEVRGPQSTDGSVTAEAITLLPSGDQLGGRVTAVSDLTITVQAPGGTSSKIVTTSSTTFRKGTASASLSDVTTGVDVRAFGTLSSGTLTATVVVIQDAPAGGPGGGPGGQGGQGGGPGGPGGGPGGPGGSGASKGVVRGVRS
jgi:hypothetical protein